MNGTAVLIATMARRLDRQGPPNAGLIQLRKAGLFYLGQLIPSAQAWPWTRSTNTLCTVTAQ